MLISILFENPLLFIIVAAALILSLTIHEYAHALCADKLGDPTARALGRVTLNPLAHLDPIGTLLLLTVGFGWGRPVPFNEYNLRHPRRDAAIIAFAGPLSNFIMATVAAILMHLFGLGGFLAIILSFIIYFNLVLGFFNLIPVHPLDGFKVVNGLLPHNLSLQWEEIQPYGVYILMIMIFTRTTSMIVSPLVGIAMKLLGIHL